MFIQFLNTDAITKRELINGKTKTYKLNGWFRSHCLLTFYL